MTLKPSRALATAPTTAAILRRCLGYLKPNRSLTLGIYGSMLVIIAITILTPQLIRRIIDRGMCGDDMQFLSSPVVTLLILAAFKALVMYLQGNWTEIISQHVAFDLRNEIQIKIDTLSFSFHNRMQTGQILSRSIQDVDCIRFLTGRAFLRLVEGIILMIGTAVVLIWMNPKLGLLVGLTMPMLIYRAYVFGSRFRPLSLKIQDQLGVLTTQAEQNLRGALVVKGFAQEDAEIDRFLAENENWFNLSVESARLQAINVPLLNFIANFGTVIILLYGGVLFALQELSL